jgi:hypothetical protein
VAGVPHLKELQEKYNASGFEIVAVSDEAEGTLEKFIKDKAITYGIVLSAKKFAELYPSDGRPSSWVLDADGKVIWKGHPASLTNEMVAEWVKDLAPTRIDRSLAKELKDAVKAFDAGQYGKASTEAAKILGSAEDETVKADARHVQDFVQKHVTAYAAKMARLRDAGDLVGLGLLIDEAAAKFDGSDQGKAWSDEAKELRKSDSYKDTVKAGEELEKLRPKLEDMKPSRAHKALEKIAKKYPDTKAGKEAAELAERYK